MENLRDRIDELQAQTGIFADLCDFVFWGHGELKNGHPNYQKALDSVLCIIRDEAARIDEASDAIFNDKRMIEFYYSLKD